MEDETKLKFEEINRIIQALSSACIAYEAILCSSQSFDFDKQKALNFVSSKPVDYWISTEAIKIIDAVASKIAPPGPAIQK